MNACEQDDDVVMTGVGIISPFAANREATWAAIQSGQSATCWNDELDSAIPLGQRVVGAKAVLPRDDHLRETGEPVIDLALIAADEAVNDARLDFRETVTERAGSVIGTSKGGLLSLERAMLGLSPESNWMRFPPNTAATAVARRFGLKGPSLCSVAACATGVVCLQRGYELIRDGFCDVVLAGSSDASLLTGIVASYRRLGVIATNFDNPATACRPFDRSRSGFAIGEGAAVVVMERRSHAARRGSKMYATWAAGGTAGEAHDITRLGDDTSTLTRLISEVVARSGVRPEEIDYCNMHGTATRANDVYETVALKAALGTAAWNLSCSSIKGATGHLLGAAGSVETAITLLAMRDGIVPPTVNLTNPDPECDLDYTAVSSREKPIRAALKLSLGFGGHLAAAVIRPA